VLFASHRHAPHIHFQRKHTSVRVRHTFVGRIWTRLGVCRAKIDVIVQRGHATDQRLEDTVPTGRTQHQTPGQCWKFLDSTTGRLEVPPRCGWARRSTAFQQREGYGGMSRSASIRSFKRLIGTFPGCPRGVRLRSGTVALWRCRPWFVSAKLWTAGERQVENIQLVHLGTAVPW
jgi:hypothetical protein